MPCSKSLFITVVVAVMRYASYIGFLDWSREKDKKFLLLYVLVKDSFVASNRK